MARRSGACRPENAFTAGILHDLGRLVLRWLAPVEFGLAVAAASTGDISLDDAERETMGYSHAEIGRDLAERWQFPPVLSDAILHHPDHALTPERDGLAGVVAQANRLAVHFGYFSGYDVPGYVPPELPRDLLGMDALAGGLPVIARRALGFIEGMTGAPGRRHAAA
jgi:HD-like signal output (HDOD) protein